MVLPGVHVHIAMPVDDVRPMCLPDSPEGVVLGRETVLRRNVTETDSDCNICYKTVSSTTVSSRRHVDEEHARVVVIERCQRTPPTESLRPSTRFGGTSKGAAHVG